MFISVTIKHRTELSGNSSPEAQEWKLAHKKIPKAAGASEQCLWRGTQSLSSLGACALTFNMHEHLGASLVENHFRCMEIFQGTDSWPSAALFKSPERGSGLLSLDNTLLSLAELQNICYIRKDWLKQGPLPGQLTFICHGKNLSTNNIPMSLTEEQTK